MCRWLERDPAGYQDGPSLYSYLGRNPMAGTDPYGLSFWGDQYDYWFGDRHGEAERTLRENQRLVERHLEEQRRLRIISDRRYLEQSVAMRRDINSVLTEMCLISWEQQERKLETYVAITITMLPVGEVVVGARALGAASVRTGTAARNAGAAGEVAGTIGGVNAVGGSQNCVNCAVATDAVLAGRPASALRGGPAPISVLERLFGTRFGTLGTIDDVERAMSAAGPGSRGIVFGSRGTQTGHVFNVINQGGVIRFLDGQAGGPATLSGFQGLRLLRTN